MRALWSDRQNCSHNVSQKVSKRIRRFSETELHLEARSSTCEYCKRGTCCLNALSGGRGCLGEGLRGVPGQVWEFRFLPSFP